MHSADTQQQPGSAAEEEQFQPVESGMAGLGAVFRKSRHTKGLKGNCGGAMMGGGATSLSPTAEEAEEEEDDDLLDDLDDDMFGAGPPTAANKAADAEALRDAAPTALTALFHPRSQSGGAAVGGEQQPSAQPHAAASLANTPGLGIRGSPTVATVPKASVPLEPDHNLPASMSMPGATMGASGMFVENPNFMSHNPEVMATAGPTAEAQRQSDDYLKYMGSYALDFIVESSTRAPTAAAGQLGAELAAAAAGKANHSGTLTKSKVDAIKKPGGRLAQLRSGIGKSFKTLRAKTKARQSRTQPGGASNPVPATVVVGVVG